MQLVRVKKKLVLGCIEPPFYYAVRLLLLCECLLFVVVVVNNPLRN